MPPKIRDFINAMNAKGIPLPLVRDPKTGVGSVSLTMVFISFNVVLIGLMGKLAGAFGGVNIQEAIYWNIMACSLYFGRTLSLGNKTVTSQDEGNDK